MKNLKKVLALVVVFTMMLSTVAFAAYPDVAEDADYATAVEVLSALDILKGDDKGNFNPDADITRAEFAAVVCRALGLEDSANGAKGSTAFADVAADHWATGYINLANQMGIINGYGDGNFGPEDKVTYEQAVKMLVCSLGFEYMAQTKGGWPTGYLVVANNYGVTAGVKATAGEPAARSVVAELTYNALDAATMEQGTFGTEENWYVYDGISRVKKTLLSEKLDIAKLTGVVVANSKSALTGASVTEKDEIQFQITNDVVDKFGYIWNQATGWRVGDQPKFKVADTNAAEFFANQVDVYVTEISRNVWEVVAITEEAGKNVTTTISTSDIDDDKTITNAKDYNKAFNDIWYFKTADARTSTKIEGAKSVALLKNNTTATWTDYVKASKKPGQIKFIDWDNDYKFDAVIVSEYTHVIVESVNTTTNVIKTKTPNLSTLRLRLDEEDVNVTIKDKAGNKVALEDIKENDVLALIADAANAREWKSTLDIIVLPSAEVSVTGSVSELDIADVKKINALDKVYVDGTAYGLNTEGNIYNLGKINEVNSVGTFYLDITGRIIGFEGDKAVSGDYAFILQAGASTDPVSAATTLLKVVTKEGEIKVYTVSDTATMSGVEAGKVGKHLEDNYKKLDKAISEYKPEDLAARLVKLNVSNAGKVTKITLAGADDSFGYDLVAGDKEYDAEDARFGSKMLTESAKVFVLDSKDLYEATTVKAVNEAFVDEGKYTVAMYKGKTDETYDIALVIKGTAKLTNTDGIAIVKSVSKTLTADNEDALIIRFIQNGSDETKSIKIIEGQGTDLTGAKGATLSASTYATLNTGDVFTYTATADGIVDSFAVIATIADDGISFKTTTYFEKSFDDTYDGYTKDVAFATGYIKDITGSVVTLDTDKEFKIKDANEYYFNRTSASRYELSTIGYQLGYVAEYEKDVSDKSYVLIRTVDDVVTDIYAIDPRSN